NLLPDTGLDIERERALCAMFINSPNYGSRCSTVVLVDNDNNVSYIERVYDLETFEHTEKEFKWKV
ncbi:MAG: NRDE family protein, partial [Cyclobacteriaceae bacterium]